MAPIRGAKNVVSSRKSSRIASRGSVSLPNNLQARVLLNRIESDAQPTRNEEENNIETGLNEPEAPPEPEVRPPARLEFTFRSIQNI